MSDMEKSARDWADLCRKVMAERDEARAQLATTIEAMQGASKIIAGVTAERDRLAETVGAAKQPKHSWRVIAEWDWVWSGNSSMLHAVGTVNNADADDEWMGEGTTVCGRTGKMLIPGFVSRMEDKRCPKCCDALGFPRGIGSPKNDAACRPLAEARIAALAAKLAGPSPAKEET